MLDGIPAGEYDILPIPAAEQWGFLRGDNPNCWCSLGHPRTNSLL